MTQEIKLIYEIKNSGGPFEHSCTPRKIEITIPGDIGLDDLLQQFEYFIKAMGYFPQDNTHLEYIDNDTQEPKLSE